MLKFIQKIAVVIVVVLQFLGVTAAAYAHFRAPRRKTRFTIGGLVAGLVAIAAGAPFIQPYGVTLASLRTLYRFTFTHTRYECRLWQSVYCRALFSC
jgi:ammonia channel protein AmtB